jgi:N-methylhydantoinase A
MSMADSRSTEPAEVRVKGSRYEPRGSVRVGVDTGGTFTDLIVYDRARDAISIAKTVTTRPDPSEGAFRTLKKAGIDPKDIETFVHGTTAATNTLIERDGAVTALFVTKGFRDILKIQRVIRKYHLRLDWVKPEHLVPRQRCYEIPERVDYAGGVRTPLDEDSVRSATQVAVEQGCEAIAVSYLFSFLNDAHERRTRELIHEIAPRLVVSLSSEVFPLWREYERTSTTVIDAYLKPRVGGYVEEFDRQCTSKKVRGLLLMQSNGGTVTPRGAATRPVALVRSGPAGGAIAGQALGRLVDEPNLILADMGGTSFDSSLIQDGSLTLMSKTELEWGIPICAPMIDVRSIGAGGGSKIWLDSAGMLRVGPESTGSEPGPACYARGGTDPAVTDANLLVGRLKENFRMAGEFPLNAELAREALAPLAEELGMSVVDAAGGALEIVNNNMAQLIRALTIDRGLDPRDFSLVAFGGAGPLHGVDLARELGIRRVIVPVYPGAFSALGAVLANARFDYLSTSVVKSKALDVETISSVYEKLERRALGDLEAEGLTTAPIIERLVEMRYDGQNWEIDVPFPLGPVTPESVATAFRTFCERHREYFGWALEEEPFEFVNFKLVVTVPSAEVRLPLVAPTGEPQALGEQPVYIRELGNFVTAAIYDRDHLGAGATVAGPAIVTEVDATAFVPPSAQAAVDTYGNLIIKTEVA